MAAVAASEAEASMEAAVTHPRVAPAPTVVAPLAAALVAIALPRPDERMEHTVAQAAMALMVEAEPMAPLVAQQATAAGPAPFHHRARILAGRQLRMVNGTASEIQARQPADPLARPSRAEIRPLPEAGILLEEHLRPEALLRLV
jgi:hypothetical protein